MNNKEEDEILKSINPSYVSCLDCKRLFSPERSHLFNITFIDEDCFNYKNSCVQCVWSKRMLRSILNRHAEAKSYLKRIYEI